MCGPNLEDTPFHIKAKPEMLKGGGGGGLLRKFYDGGVPIGTLAQFYESGPILIVVGSSDWAVCGPNLEDTPY